MIGKRDALYIILGWTILAVAAGVQEAFAASEFHMHATWAAAFREGFLNWYTCAIFTPVLFFAVARWPLGKASGWVVWLGYTMLVAVCTVLKFALWAPIYHILEPNEESTFTAFMAEDFVFQFFAFSAVVGILLALVYYRSFKERETRASQLEATLSRAQLDALRVQLQPHFLFNTLNSIAALMHIDVDAADEMLGRLSDLLRRTLQRSDVQEVSVEEELETLGRYVDIMRVRFRERLSVEIDVDERARRCMVPHFILQPIFENAVEHGVDRVFGKCAIRLIGSIETGVLRISISDHGPGLQTGRAPNMGIGLSNTRRRLAALYGSSASLSIESGETGGLTVRMQIPARALEPL